MDTLSLLARGLVLLLDVPPSWASDPGPSAACPSDMRLVEGVHVEDRTLWCTKSDTQRQVFLGKPIVVQHCWAFHPDLVAEEGRRTPTRVCMDQFEAPNRRGARPLVMQSLRTAEAWCGARKKRVCTEEEWELACEGPRGRPWAYGWAAERSTCNSDKPWKVVDFARFERSRASAKAESERLWQGAPSGRYAGCMSPFGIYDLNGNVEEWVVSRKGRAQPGSLMGGFWAKPWTGCRGANDEHGPDFEFYETGFRCCADPLP